MRCAAGCLIGDHEYDPDWEGMAWDALVYADKIPHHHQSLIMACQSIHDAPQDHLNDREWIQRIERKMQHLAEQLPLFYAEFAPQ